MLNYKYDPPREVFAVADTGATMLPWALSEYLDEVGIYECADDTGLSTDVIRHPDDCAWAAKTCNYMRKLTQEWILDPVQDRHPWLLCQFVRLESARRYLCGCLTQADYQHAAQVLCERFEKLCARPGDTRNIKRHEIRDIRNEAVDRAARKTDEQLARELGSHVHHDAKLLRRPGSAFNPSAAFFGFTEKGQHPSAQPVDPQSNSWGVVTGGAFILDQPANIPAIWGRGNQVLWPEGEGFMIAGGQGLGKTGIAGQLVRELLGLGDGTVFGLPVNGSGEIILYLAMDRPRQIARSMARQFDVTEREILDARLLIRPGPPPADLAKNPELLLCIASQVGAGIVFIDSLKDAALGLSDDEVGASYNRARQLLLNDKRQLCDLHHLVKRGVAGKPPTTIADIYGSTWLTSGCGSVVLLSGDPGDPIIKLRHVKPPADEIGPLTLIADAATGRFTAEHQTDLLTLADHGDSDEATGVTAKGAAMALFDTAKPTKAETAKARHKLDQLASDGLLSQREGGPGGFSARWFPTGRTSE